MKLLPLALAGVALVVLFSSAKKARPMMTIPGERYMITQRIESEDGSPFTQTFLESFAATLGGQVQLEPLVQDGNAVFATYRFVAVKPVDMAEGNVTHLGPFKATTIHFSKL